LADAEGDKHGIVDNSTILEKAPML